MTKEFKKTSNPNPNYVPPSGKTIISGCITILFYETNATEWFFCTTENRIIPNKNDCVIIDNVMYAVKERIIDYDVGQVYVFVKYLKQVKRYDNDTK